MISYICRQPGDGTGIRGSALYGERLKDPVGPGHRFASNPPRPEDAIAARKINKITLLFSTW
jgi:hypothetical protein